ncbi:MAG: carbohydrate binding family 9 domain-containing protein [Chitinophagaceae bacterium]|nr:carbohydrate binding family 9 domain-containing protein [Chitinophagaceae bacterium]
MKRKQFFLLIPAMLCWSFIQSQKPPQRELPAVRKTQPIKIDGLVNEPAWKDAPMMTDLVEFRPTMGAKEKYETRSETWLMYDDAGIYFGGFFYERTKDSIARELVGRDGFGTNDYVGLILDTYRDNLNGFEYFVTPLNEQWDAKMTEGRANTNSEDFTWNSVWQSGAVIHDNGWSFEMFIPYSAIRFGKKEVQNWGMNITRRRRKTEQQYTWNPIDVKVNGFLTQEGLWTGITNIKPPLRLQFSPYFSVYANHYPLNQQGAKNLTAQVNGGMDVKYGINQAFTLDVTLIPDFGQVQSDNRVLNLTPFGVRYTENRPFFTEGTELFSKGNLFYPRRIGIDPILLHSTDEYKGPGEEAVRTAVESKLINATKVSGRTSKGLGIGVLNAVTNNRYATLENTTTGDRRKVMIDPLTNSSVIVLDQTLKNNSSVSFVNTNVWRSGTDYDANVMAGLFSFNNKKNVWNVSGKFANSRLIGYNADGTTQSGYSHNISFGKTSGNFNFSFVQDFSDRKFNSNDLAYFTFNNYVDHSFWMVYRWVKPSSWYNNWRINFNSYYSRRVLPAAYRNAAFNINTNGQLKNLWWVGALVGFEPRGNDFNEPRKEGRVFKGWESRFIDLWVETNQSKKYSVFSEIFVVSRSLYKSKRYVINFSQRYRFSDKFSVRHELNMEPQTNNVGFADIVSNTDVIFGRRDRNTVENIINLKYNFNAKMGLNTRIRHYWSKVEYKEYFTLLENGDITSNPGYTGNMNQNVNFFNVDMVYTWQFAPGSFLNLVWKDAGFTYQDAVERSYFKNFTNTLQSNQNNNLSLKVIYFLDYLEFRKWGKKKVP